MKFYNLISDKFILPIGDVITNQTIAKNIKFLCESQNWSRKELINFQEKKLRKLTYHCTHNVPYYRDLFLDLGLSHTEIQSVSDIYKLPILTKEIIKREGINRFIPLNFKLGKSIKRSTSGSTGQPLQYYISKDAYSMNIASNLRGWFWMGYKLGDPVIKIDNSPRIVKKKLQDFISNTITIDSSEIEKNGINQIVDLINKKKPKVIRSYVAPLTIIVDEVQKKNLELFKPDLITTTGSVLRDEIREKIESYFNCKIFDSYSCEGGANLFECPTHEMYHSSEEYAITEVIDEQGNHSNEGRLITTDLWNYSTPFIRYDSQDQIRLSVDVCSCGRQLLGVKKIFGRDTDFLINKDGNKINPLQISKLFSKYDELITFQVYQQKRDKIIIKYVGSCNEIEISQKLKKIIGDYIIINFQNVDSIELTSSMKRRYIVRNKEITI